MKLDDGTKFYPNIDFVVKALMTLNDSYYHEFEMKTDTKVKTCLCTELCTQNNVLDSKCKFSDNKRLPLSCLFTLKTWIENSLKTLCFP